MKNMITVVILINNHPIFTRSAIRGHEVDGHLEGKGTYEYRLYDEDLIIYHNPKDGAIELAKKMLDIAETRRCKKC